MRWQSVLPLDSKTLAQLRLGSAIRPLAVLFRPLSRPRRWNDHVLPAFQNSQDHTIPRPIAPVAAGILPGARANRDVQSNPALHRPFTKRRSELGVSGGLLWGSAVPKKKSPARACVPGGLKLTSSWGSAVPKKKSPARAHVPGGLLSRWSAINPPTRTCVPGGLKL
jgi:hypothetical protein